MNVLVTGGSGVFGSHLLRQLVKMGYRPIAIGVRGDTSLIGDLLDKIVFLKGDILDFPFIFETIKKYDVTGIAHLSALMPGPCQTNPPLGVEVNLKGTVNMLEAARVYGIKRFVYTSAKGIYGDIKAPYGHPQYRPLPETAPANPDRIYELTKYAGELVGRNYEKNYGIEFVTLRFSSTYGPGKLARHGPLAIHSKILENAMCGAPTVISQGGEQKDDMVYVKDVANSIACALFAKDPKSRIYNIGLGRGVTMRDYADAVKRHFPDARIEIGPGLKFFGENLPSYYCIYDISRAKAELNYQPAFDLETGVSDYISTMEFLGLKPSAT